MSTQSRKTNSKEDLGVTQREIAKMTQAVLICLLDLNSQIKQAHWNIEGEAFLSFHRQLDDIYHYFDEAIDQLAERQRSLGVHAIGSPKVLAENSELESFPEGLVTVNNAMILLSSRLNAASFHVRSVLERIDELDPVTNDLLVQICGNIEKFKWLIDSQIVVERF